MTTYQITAGDNSTDLGIVAETETLQEAIKAGREAVRGMLPGGSGSFKVRGPDGFEQKYERSVRTGFKFIKQN